MCSFEAASKQASKQEMGKIPKGNASANELRVCVCAGGGQLDHCRSHAAEKEREQNREREREMCLSMPL